MKSRAFRRYWPLMLGCMIAVLLAIPHIGIKYIIAPLFARQRLCSTRVFEPLPQAAKPTIVSGTLQTDMRWIGSRPLVLYSADCLEAGYPKSFSIAADILKPSPFGWLRAYGAGGGQNDFPPRSEAFFVHRLMSDLRNPGFPERFTLLYGRIFDPEVAKMKVSFGDGTVIEDTKASI